MYKQKDLKSNISSIIIHAYENNDIALKEVLKSVNYLENVSSSFPQYKYSTDSMERTPEINEPLFYNISYTVPIEYWKDLFDINWVIEHKKISSREFSIAAKLIETKQFDEILVVADLLKQKLKEVNYDELNKSGLFPNLEKNFFLPILDYARVAEYALSNGFTQEEFNKYEKVFEEIFNFYFEQKNEETLRLYKDTKHFPERKFIKWFKSYEKNFSTMYQKSNLDTLTSTLLHNPLALGMTERLIDSDAFSMSATDSVKGVLGCMLKNKYDLIELFLNKKIISKEVVSKAFNDLSKRAFDFTVKLFADKNEHAQSLINAYLGFFNDGYSFLEKKGINVIGTEHIKSLILLSSNERTDKLTKLENFNKMAIFPGPINIGECHFLKCILETLDQDLSSIKKEGIKYNNTEYSNMLDFFVKNLPYNQSKYEINEYERNSVTQIINKNAVSFYNKIPQGFDDYLSKVINQIYLENNLLDKSNHTKKVKI